VGGKRKGIKRGLKYSQILQKERTGGPVQEPPLNNDHKSSSTTVRSRGKRGWHQKKICEKPGGQKAVKKNEKRKTSPISDLLLGGRHLGGRTGRAAGLHGT